MQARRFLARLSTVVCRNGARSPRSGVTTGWARTRPSVQKMSAPAPTSLWPQRYRAVAAAETKYRYCPWTVQSRPTVEV
jgi:hypothetical protein